MLLDRVVGIANVPRLRISPEIVIAEVGLVPSTGAIRVSDDPDENQSERTSFQFLHFLGGDRGIVHCCAKQLRSWGAIFSCKWPILTSGAVGSFGEGGIGTLNEPNVPLCSLSGLLRVTFRNPSEAEQVHLGTPLDGWSLANVFERNICLDGLSVKSGNPYEPRNVSYHIGPLVERKKGPGIIQGLSGSIRGGLGGISRYFGSDCERRRKSDLLNRSSGLLLGGFRKDVSVVSSRNNFIQRYTANTSEYDSEDCNPDRSVGGSPSRLLLGCLCFILGAALMKLSFYLADGPHTFGSRVLYVGCGILAAASIWESINLVGRFIVTQKHLQSHWFSYYNKSMPNVLPKDKQIAIIASLAEGSSIRSIEPITGVHRDTIMRLGVRVGKGCTALMDAKMRNLSCTRLEMDEVWGFIGKKERHMRPDDDPQEYGDSLDVLRT